MSYLKKSQRRTLRTALHRTRAFALLSLLAAACDPPPEYDRTPPLIEPSRPTNSSDECAPAPNDQTSSSGTVYYLYTAQKNWTAAKADCEAMGGRLAVPTSSTINTLLKNENNGQPSHIGFYQPNNQSSPSVGWVTVDGVTPSYTNWGSGEPNDTQGTENNEENCTILRADGKWNDAGCTSVNRQYFCEFSSAPVSCGGGSSCSIPSGGSTYSCQCPSGQSYDADSNTCLGGPLTIEVNKLNVDQFPSGSGNAFVNFPIRAKVGLKGTGNTNKIQVTLGMMERPASGASATQAEIDALRSCNVAGTKVTLPGDGSQTDVTIEGLVSPECLGTDAQRTYNFYVLLDPIDDVTTEPEKFRVYSDAELSSAMAQQCKRTNPMTGVQTAGCIYNVTVRPSPGLDIALYDAKPLSSVGVLDPGGQHPSVPSGQTEGLRPITVVNVSLAAFGRDFDDPNAPTLPSSVPFQYTIRAASDPNNVGWKSLNVNPDGGYASLSSLTPGEQLQVESRLHPTSEFRTLTSAGGPWAGVTSFNVRACVGPPFAEQGDPTFAGMDGRLNNCKEFPIQLVAGSFDSTSASSQSETKTISETYGSSSSIALSLSGGSTNSFSLTGASSTNSAKATLSGFFGSFTLFDAWGNGAASVSPAQGTIDYGLKVFGVSLLPSPPGSASSVTYTTGYTTSKESCITYTYGAVLINVSLKGCFEAAAGIPLTVTATGTSVSANVRPYLSATLSVSGEASVTLYKASLTASLTVLGLNTSSGDGVTATLSYAVNSTSPVKLTIGFSIGATFRITTLNGSLTLSVEQYGCDWCSKKVWFVRVYYPCNCGYDTIAEYNLFSYKGYSYTNTLLARTGSNIVLQ